jgi:deoxyxylulose-5-phosphate synthase
VRALAAAAAVGALTCYRLVEPDRVLDLSYADTGAIPLAAAMALSALAVYLWRKA